MTLHINYTLTSPVVLNASFEVRGFTALLGRSGAGKTSLLKALAGLLPATGTPWGGLPPQDRPIGYLPQSAALFPHLTVLENAAFALTGPDRLQNAQAYLDSLNIGHLAARFGAKISGGEAQRVGLARALARRPELLLLDEPSAALDAATRDEVLAQLIETIDATGIPALAATHDPAIAALADWVVLLADDQIIQQGTPRHLFDNPASIAAAQLLGYQNFWPQDGATGAIRAEDIQIAPSGRPAIITGIREQSRDLRLSCEMPEPVTVIIRAGDAAAYEIGRQVNLFFPPAKVRVLSS
ncbi:MAG: ABC transporter ATP-binding protein [Acidocella sp.]|nr:ABC transporter ATP-binding protein [Acidocella sp.]